LERCDAKRSLKELTGGLLAQDGRGNRNAVHRGDYFHARVQVSHKWPPDFDEIVSGPARCSAATDFSPLSDGVQSVIATQFGGATALRFPWRKYT
jgi:hypothetical protein